MIVLTQLNLGQLFKLYPNGYNFFFFSQSLAEFEENQPFRNLESVVKVTQVDRYK